MCSVGRDVSALVVTVKSEVETETVDETLVIAGAQHGGEVLGPIGVQVDGGELAAFLVGVLVDLGRDGGELGEEVDAVIVDWLPVVSLVETLLIGLSEDRVVVQGSDAGDELAYIPP